MYFVYTDGGYRESHKIGIGSFIILHEGTEVTRRTRILNEAKSNMEAEYEAIYNALWYCNTMGWSDITLLSDSQTAIYQLKKERRITKERIQKYFNDITELVSTMNVKFVWKSRKMISICEVDEICNKWFDKYINDEIYRRKIDENGGWVE